MRIFVTDQQRNFDALLSDLISRPVADASGISLKSQISSVEIQSNGSLGERDYNILFDYRIFPPSIMTHRGEWLREQRRMQVGDTIVQQVYVPPFPAFSQKIIFGVRIDSIIDEPARKGFSYQTLDGHAEIGRSVFTFENSAGKNIFRIETLSAPGNLLSKLTGPFFTRPYQSFCTKKALENVKSQIL